MSLLAFGYLGLFVGTFLSATLIPFPSDVILLGSYEGGLLVVPCLIIATIGNLLGALTNYFIGYKSNSEKLIKKFNLNQDRLDRWEKRLSKNGIYLGLLAWMPFVGEPMVAALGFFKVRFWPLTLMMLIGKFLRYLTITIIYFYGFVH
jgi:membrane protein YqaA with SNARE-associated domain